jgi:hypothetical protein
MDNDSIEPNRLARPLEPTSAVETAHGFRGRDQEVVRGRVEMSEVRLEAMGDDAGAVRCDEVDVLSEPNHKVAGPELCFLERARLVRVGVQLDAQARLSVIGDEDVPRRGWHVRRYDAQAYRWCR